MNDSRRRRLWRTISFSAVPLLTLLAVVLIRSGNGILQFLGALAGIAAAGALVGPFVIGR